MELEQHIHFWIPQIIEHAKILRDMTTDEAWKRRFNRNLIRWKTDGQGTQLELLADLAQLQSVMLTQILRSGNSMGVSAALLTHMLKEQGYFVKVLRGEMTPEEERHFWAEEASEHTRLSGQMIDPLDIKSQIVSDQMTQTAHDIHGAQKFGNKHYYMKQATQQAQKILEAVSNKELHLLMPPLALSHEIRESQQGEFRLALLNEKYGPSSKKEGMK